MNLKQKKVNIFFQYGIPEPLANKLIAQGLTATSVRSLRLNQLVEKFSIEEAEARFVKKCIIRQPIPEETIALLLENNSHTCCVCKGIKGEAYIIHHINEYSKTQDNDYGNLVVLCPVCHDFAHTPRALSMGITKQQLFRRKVNWEKEVQENKVKALSLKGKNLASIDYINVPRLTELAAKLLRVIPRTKYLQGLIQRGVLNEDGEFNEKAFLRMFSRDKAHSPFDLQGSLLLCLHYEEVFNHILLKLNFDSLDDLIKSKRKIGRELIGKYCFYIGGLYGKKIKMPVSLNSPLSKLHFSKRKIMAEWIINPAYLLSSTAIARACDRSTYIIFGVIRDVVITNDVDKKKYKISLQPYLAGMPVARFDRGTSASYLNYEEYSEDFAEK